MSKDKAHDDGNSYNPAKGSNPSGTGVPGIESRLDPKETITNNETKREKPPSNISSVRGGKD